MTIRDCWSLLMTEIRHRSSKGCFLQVPRLWALLFSQGCFPQVPRLWALPHSPAASQDYLALLLPHSSLQEDQALLLPSDTAETTGGRRQEASLTLQTNNSTHKRVRATYRSTSFAPAAPQALSGLTFTLPPIFIQELTGDLFDFS